MKRLATLVFGWCLATALCAAPACPGILTAEQPDGTTLEICLYGDEFCHYATTADGFLVAENYAGVYEYAEFDGASGTVRPLGVKAHAAANRTPVEWLVADKSQTRLAAKALARQHGHGEPSYAPETKNLVKKVLVVLAEFQDVAFDVGNTRDDFDLMMNGEHYGYADSPGSVGRYFADQSNGKYKPQFDVVGPVVLPQPCAYYGADNGRNTDVRIADMVMDACRLAHESCHVDFSEYDADGDKFVDCVYVLYAGRGQADGGSANTVWPKNWDLVNAIYSGYVEDRDKYVDGNVVTCPVYDGVRVNTFVCTNELRNQRMRAGIGVVCHEFSHVLGLPDYYNTVSQSGVTPCAWSVMDVGMYNNGGITPPNYSVHDKYLFGWATPTVLQKPQNIVLRPERNDYRMVTKDGKPKPATATDTVFYLEDRQQDGWDAWLPGHGLLVTRVVYSPSLWQKNRVNVSSLRYAVVPADGQMRDGDAGDAFPGAANVTEFAPFATCRLTDIAEHDGKIMFRFTNGKGGCDGYRCLSLDLENCTAFDEVKCVPRGGGYTVKIVPDAGYELLQDDDHFVIVMDDDFLEAGDDFTYADGVLSIPNVSDFFEVWAVATKRTETALPHHALTALCVVSEPHGLRLAGLPAGACVRIYDALGCRRVADRPQTDEKLYALPDGVYLVRIEADGAVTTLKAVKQ